MKVEVYKGAQGKHNLKDYEEIYIILLIGKT